MSAGTPVRIVIGTEAFSARLRRDLAPYSCRQLEKLFPYIGQLMHARWSGEALWSRLCGVWSPEMRLPKECPTSTPEPGDLLLFAGEQSEPELFIPYGDCRFACAAGQLEGNPVLSIDVGIAQLADIGRAVLQHGAVPIRIENDSVATLA